MRMARLRGPEGERGAVVVIVVLLLVAMFGMVALTVDVGGLLSTRRSLVRGVDSGALAAAQSCAGTTDVANAPARATAFVQSNVPAASVTQYQAEGCGTESAGVVLVGAETEQDLPFAVVLGFPRSKTVTATARALWGPSTSANVLPIEFPVDEFGTLPCLVESQGPDCSYWYDPSNDHDVTNSSNYGFLNLDDNGITNDPNAACPAAGSSELRDWILETRLVSLNLNDLPTYICFTGGHRADTWFDALASRAGDDVPESFPINDPDLMVRTTGKEKAYVIGFFSGYIQEVLRGNDPRATGTPAQSGGCRVDHTFRAAVPPTSYDTWDLDDAPCLSGINADSITNLKLRKGGTRFVRGIDYSYNSSTHVITWLRTETVTDVQITFDWYQGGTPGACGFHSPDPNAVCVTLEYQGAIFNGGGPCTDCPDFGTRGVRLCDPLGEPPDSPCAAP